ncbi:hypothetical protein Ddc_13918 [Ditylenchus destructor]|nr:hypothetical protein Ddc_13918 [Ditylenchus destructor]
MSMSVWEVVAGSVLAVLLVEGVTIWAMSWMNRRMIEPKPYRAVEKPREFGDAIAAGYESEPSVETEEPESRIEKKRNGVSFLKCKSKKKAIRCRLYQPSEHRAQIPTNSIQPRSIAMQNYEAKASAGPLEVKMERKQSDSDQPAQPSEPNSPADNSSAHLLDSPTANVDKCHFLDTSAESKMVTMPSGSMKHNKGRLIGPMDQKLEKSGDGQQRRMDPTKEPKSESPNAINMDTFNFDTIFAHHFCNAKNFSQNRKFSQNLFQNEIM